MARIAVFFLLAVLAGAGLLAMVGPARGGDRAEMGYRALFDILEGDGPIDRVLDRDNWPEDDLLASYLELEIFFHPRDRATVARLRSFIKRWPDHPQINRVLSFMDRRITQDGGDAETLAWFDERPARSRTMKIRHLRLLMAANRLEEALAIWRDLYRDASKVPASVTRRTARFSSRLTQEDHEARALALINARRFEDFRRHLSRIDAPQRRAYLRAMAAAKRTLRKFNDIVRGLPRELARDSALWYARLEGLRRGKYWETALKILDGPEGGYLNAEDRHRIRFRIGRDLIYRSGRFADAHRVLSPNVRERGGRLSDSLWLAGLAAHLAGMRDQALAHFQQLGREGATARRKSQGAFWAARLIGDDRGAGRPWLEMAAAHPETFYGLLAAETLTGRLPAFAPHPVECEAVAGRPELAEGTARMRRLEAVGRSYYNSGEIERLAERHNLAAPERICLARAFGAPNQAVRSGGAHYAETGEALWDGLYPVPPWSPQGGWRLDRALIWGLGRQESLFFHRVESSAQAKGILQLIPPTARHEANLLGMPRSTRYRMQLPAYNLALGQSYLSRMAQKFDGDLVLALISYNAGPHRAARWAPRRSTEAPLDFIETIPFTETRHYVKRVMHGFAIYRQRLNGAGSLLDLLPAGRPGMAYLQPTATAIASISPENTASGITVSVITATPTRATGFGEDR